MNKVNGDTYGCDVGNGFGMISVLSKNDQEPHPVLPALRNLNDKEGMPTAVYFTPPEGDPVMVFDRTAGSAEAKIARDPAHGVRAVKTRLREGVLHLPGIEGALSPYDAYAAIARDLVKLGNYQRALEGEAPIYRMVLAYPSALMQYDTYLDILDGMQRSIESVELDGHRLEVAARIPEPAAAAIDYLHKLQTDGIIGGDEFCAIVYDLGFGTFDVAAVTARAQGDPFDVWASDGLPDVGGKDFDRRLYDELAGQLSREYGYEPASDQERETLRRLAVEAKCQLTDNETWSGEHQSHRGDGAFMELEVTRGRFEEITRDLLLQTVEKTAAMIEAQRAEGRRIDAIVLSGGASQMPMVRTALEALAGDSVPIHLFRPGQAVSFGAARYARGIAQAEETPDDASSDTGARDEGRSAQDAMGALNPVATLRAPHDYGVLMETGKPLRGFVHFGIESGASLPAAVTIEEFPCPASPYDVRLYRVAPDAIPPRARSNPHWFTAAPQYCQNLRRLHFNVPAPGTYRLRMKVDANNTVAVTLENDAGWHETHSTAERFERS